MREETTNHNTDNSENNEVRLAEARAKEAEETRRIEELRAENLRIANENSELKLTSLLTAALEQSDIQFHPSLEQLRVIAEHACRIKFGLAGNGSLQASRDGQPLDVQKAFDTIAVEAGYTANMTSGGYKRVRMAPGEGVRARSDLRTPQERSEFIRLHGLQAFETLPSRRVDAADIGVMTASQYRSLTATQKADIAQEIGSEGIARICVRKG